MSAQDKTPMFEDRAEGFEIRFHKGGVIFTHVYDDGDGLLELDYYADPGRAEEICEALKVELNLWWPTHGDLPPIGEVVLARRRRSTASPEDKSVYIVLERTGTESNWSWRQPGLLGLCASEEITHWQPLPKGEFS